MKKRDMRNITRNILAILVCTSILFTGQATNTFANSTDNLINTLGLEDNEDSFSNDTYEKKERTEKSKASLVEDEELLDEDNFMTSDNTEEGILPEANGVNEAKMEPKERNDVSADGLSHVTTVTKNAAYIKYFNWNGTGVVTDMKGHMYWMCEDGSEKIYPDEVTDTGVYIFHDFYKDHTDKPSDEAAWDLWVDNIRYGGIKVFGRSASNTYPDGQKYCDSFFTARSLSEYCPGNNYDNVKWHKHFCEYQDYADDFGENHSNEMIYCAWIEEPWDIEWYSKDGNKYFHKTSKKDDGNGIFHTGAGNIIFGDFYCSFGELSDGYSRHYCEPQYNFEGISIHVLSGVDDAQETGTYGVGKRKWQRDGDSNIVDGESTQHYRTKWSNDTDETYDISVENIPSQPIHWYEYDENAEYTLTYEKNDGSGSIINTYKYHASDSVTVIGPNTLSRKGYIFGGWNTEKDGSGTTYGEGATISLRKDTTLYAYWIPVSAATKIEINYSLVVLRSKDSTAKDLYYFDVDDLSGEISIYLNLNDSEYSGEYKTAPYTVTLLDDSGNICSIKNYANPTRVQKNDDEGDDKKWSVFYNINLPTKGRYYLSIIGANGISSVKTNYSITVKQSWLADFVLGRDNGCFGNCNKEKLKDFDYLGGFDRNNYQLEDEYFQKLFDICPKENRYEINAIRQHIPEEFRGACYGICFSMGAAFDNKDSFSKISSDSVSDYYSVDPPYLNNKLDQTIIMYQLSTYIDDGSRVCSTDKLDYLLTSQAGGATKLNVPLDDFLKKMVEYIKVNKMGILNMETKNRPPKTGGCHAVLITGCEYDAANKKYKVRLYDPNSGARKSTNKNFSYMYIDDDFRNFDMVLPDAWPEIKIDNSKYLWLEVHNWNTSDLFVGHDTTPSFFGDYTLYLPTDEDITFQILNRDGDKILSWDGENAQVNGCTITDIRRLGAYGEGKSFIELQIKGLDDEIVVEPLSREIQMSIYSSTGYIGLEGNNITKANIDLSAGMTIVGNNYTFNGFIDIGNGNNMVSISGDATSDVKIEQDGNTIKVTSDNDIKNITTKEYIDNEVKEEEVPDGKEIEVVTERTKTIVAGQKINLKGTCFSDVTDTISRYVVDNNKLASVSKQMLTGKKPGTVKVTAQKQIGKKEYQNIGECTVTILNKPKLKFAVPMTYNGQTLNASDFFMTDDTNLLGATEWESSKPNIVEVADSKTGLLKAYFPGSAKITAYFGERGKPGTLKISANITVKYPSFQKTEYKVQTGAKLILAMKNVNAALNPAWRVSDESVAHAAPQLDRKGNKTGKVEVEGLSYGDTTLTGTIDGQEYTCTIHVTAPVIYRNTMTIGVNKSGTLSLKNTKIKKTDVKWESSDTSIATVDANGKVTGVSKGEVVISTDTGGYHNECTVTVK